MIAALSSQISGGGLQVLAVCLTCVHSVVELSALEHLSFALCYLSKPLLVPHHHLDQMLTTERSKRGHRSERGDGSGQCVSRQERCAGRFEV